MVFPSISESDSPAPTIPMASPIVSSKSQPLHNFALTDLKWSPAPHPRFRRPPTDSAHGSPFRDVPARPSESDPEGCRRHRAVDDLPPLGSSARDSGEKDMCQPVAAAENGKSSSKILLRIRAKGKSSDPPAEAEAEAEAPAAPAKPEASPSEPEELMSKVWNLRPRKPITKKSGNGGSQRQEIKSLHAEEPGRSGAEATDERKVKFSIALTREEIEADFLAFTGSRPARRPRKRPRTVQRALDFCFPGLWLGAITPDSYKVAGNPSRG